MDAAKKTTLHKRLLFGGLTIGLIVGIACLDAFVIPAWPSLIVISGLGLLAQREIRVMVEGKISSGAISLFYWLGIGILTFFVAYAAQFPADERMVLPFLLIVLVPVVVLMKGFPFDHAGLRNAAAPYLLGYLALGISSLVFLRKDARLGGLESLLFLIAVAKVGDIAAYFVGSFAGKRKMAPAISPNKTWEGAIASLLAAVGLAALLQSQGWAAGLSSEQALIAGLVINVAAQFSDLSKSVLKRACGVKDSGSYFSVMGGALDMIDSLIFAAPAYVALRLLWA